LDYSGHFRRFHLKLVGHLPSVPGYCGHDIEEAGGHLDSASGKCTVVREKF
jgi:hypothetical protein